MKFLISEEAENYDDKMHNSEESVEPQAGIEDDDDDGGGVDVEFVDSAGNNPFFL